MKEYSKLSNSKNVVDFIHRRKKNLRKLFDSKCCLCGYNLVETALEFHHVNPEEKEFSIGSSENQTKALDKQLKELKKCILVCANCHRAIHQGVLKIPENWQDFYNEDVANQLQKELEAVKQHKIYYCKSCGTVISKGAKYCTSCYAKKQRIVERPNREELKNLIRTLPFTQIAAKYGVTDNAIRKWCNSMNLPKRKTDINKYSDQEWKKI